LFDKGERHWGARASTPAGGADLIMLLALIFQLLLKLVGLSALLSFSAYGIELLN